MQMPLVPQGAAPDPIFPLAQPDPPQTAQRPPVSPWAQTFDALVVLVACLAYTAVGVAWSAAAARLTHLWPCVLIAAAGWLSAGVLAALVLMES